MIREEKRGKKGTLEAVRYFKFQHHPRGVVSFPYLFKIEWQVIQKILDFSRSRKFLDDRQLPAIQNFLDFGFHYSTLNSLPHPAPLIAWLPLPLQRGGVRQKARNFYQHIFNIILHFTI